MGIVFAFLGIWQIEPMVPCRDVQPDEPPADLIHETERTAHGVQTRSLQRKRSRF